MCAVEARTSVCTGHGSKFCYDLLWQLHRLAATRSFSAHQLMQLTFVFYRARGTILSRLSLQAFVGASASGTAAEDVREVHFEPFYGCREVSSQEEIIKFLSVIPTAKTHFRSPLCLLFWNLESLSGLPPG